MEFAFHFYNSLAETGALMAFERLLEGINAPPVVVCVGSDLAIGDSLGPLTGTLLRERVSSNGAYVYGTLKSPVTAKEVKYMNDFLKKTHPNSKIIAVDAAVGEDNEVGLVKISDTPLRPGSGAKKKLGKLGDVSVLGVVAKKSAFSYSSLNLTRLNMVYTMSEMIAEALSAYISRATSTLFTKKAL